MGTTGIPTGGLTGQILSKTNSNDFNTQWTTIQVPEFLPETTMVFYQATAPIGWAQTTNLYDPNGFGFMLHVVSYGFTLYGGTMDPRVNNILIAHNHAASVNVNDPGHQHWMAQANDGRISGSSEFGGGDAALGQGVYTDFRSTGITFEMSIAAAGDSKGWEPQYIDCIICQKTATASYNVEIETQSTSIFDTSVQVGKTITTIYFQSNAPVGWTQNTGYNSFMLRVVNGYGGGSGGYMEPTVMDVVVDHTHAVSYSLNDPGHSHSYTTRYVEIPQTGT